MLLSEDDGRCFKGNKGSKQRKIGRCFLKHCFDRKNVSNALVPAATFVLRSILQGWRAVDSARFLAGRFIFPAMALASDDTVVHSMYIYTVDTSLKNM